VFIAKSTQQVTNIKGYRMKYVILLALSLGTQAQAADDFRLLCKTIHRAWVLHDGIEIVDFRTEEVPWNGSDEYEVTQAGVLEKTQRERKLPEWAKWRFDKCEMNDSGNVRCSSSRSPAYSFSTGGNVFRYYKRDSFEVGLCRNY
jgi:hypothetical protein